MKQKQKNLQQKATKKKKSFCRNVEKKLQNPGGLTLGLAEVGNPQYLCKGQAAGDRCSTEVIANSGS